VNPTRQEYSRVAALYDIHGNLPALEAVLNDIRRAEVDQVVVGGDVLPGPMPRETLSRLLDLDLPVRFIQGNGDRVVLAQMRGTESNEVPEPFREGIRWNALQLDPEDERVLASWPPTCRVRIRGVGDVLFCHATPRNDTDVFTRLTPEDQLLTVFEGLDAPMVVCGHTHMQFDRTIGTAPGGRGPRSGDGWAGATRSETRVVNAGSVGMPFAAPGAYWLLLGPDIQLRQTLYDFTKAADRVRQTKYPQAQDFAEKNVLQPPSEEEMLKAFSRIELK
jgi:diadenosine tetraphosphatase ApaH/serine/threonine PP2A family protein phosphatase